MKKNKIRMQTKIWVVLCGFIMLPLCALSLLCNDQVRKLKREEIVERSYALADKNNSLISGKIEDMKQGIYLFSHTKGIEERLSDLSKEASIHDKYEVFCYLTESAAIYSNFHVQVFVGESIFRTGNPAAQNMVIDVSCIEDEEYYREIMNGRYQYYFFWEETDSGQASQICVIHRISDEYDKNNVGAIVKFGFYVDPIIQQMRDDRIFENMLTMITDSEGNRRTGVCLSAGDSAET